MPTINTVSKSKLALYNKCPLYAYNELRSNSQFKTNRLMSIGSAAHAIAAEKISSMFGLEFDSTMVTEDIETPAVVEALKMVSRVNFQKMFEGLELVGVEERFSFDITLPSEETIKASGIWDAISIMDDKIIVVHEFKSSFYVKKDIDAEALVYAFAAYKKFGMPVLFVRRSLSMNDEFSEYFSKEQLDMLEPLLLRDIEKYKREMEDEDLLPEHKPGGHCEYCPFVTSCQGRKIQDTIPNKVKASLIAKMYAKIREDEVKNYAKEKLNEIAENGESLPTSEDGSIEIEVGDSGYGVALSASTSWGLKGRKISKHDVLKLLIEKNDLPVENLDLKFDEELCQKLEDEYQIPCKSTTRKTLKIVKGVSDE